MTIAREIVWSLGKWKTKELDNFIESFNSDVYFVPIYPVVYMGKLQLYILKKHPKPYVCYLADDNYSYKICGNNPAAYIHRFLLRRVVRKLAVNCDEMFTITKTEAEDTDKQFGTHSIVLTKGIDYTNLTFHEKEIQEPIKMVYTGKLVIGRASSLVTISKALSEINRDRIRMTLDIYSPDVMDSKTMQALNSNGCHFCGCVPKEKVAAIQDSADIVIFVESLEKKYRYAARLSFSTKLTDYFKSGKCIFAIGDKSIAPIEYLNENDAAVIATENSEVGEKLLLMADNPEIIKKYSKKSFDCGKLNHDEQRMKETLLSTFIRASRKEAAQGR
jgi:glycosyltransferase involved in cell wall biosynthesis